MAVVPFPMPDVPDPKFQCRSPKFPIPISPFPCPIPRSKSRIPGSPRPTSHYARLHSVAWCSRLSALDSLDDSKETLAHLVHSITDKVAFDEATIDLEF